MYIPKENGDIEIYKTENSQEPEKIQENYKRERREDFEMPNTSSPYFILGLIFLILLVLIVGYFLLQKFKILKNSDSKSSPSQDSDSPVSTAAVGFRFY
jgi:hypothetical protein